MSSASYDPNMDLNRDGIINADDDSIWSTLGIRGPAADGEICGRGYNGVDNVVGYCGYIFAPEITGGTASQRYCVRFRWYDPVGGRWMQRDPVAYIDGMNLYEYCRSSSLKYRDPLGLDGILEWIPFVRTVKKLMESTLGTSEADYAECGILHATRKKCEEDALLAEDNCIRCHKQLLLKRIGGYFKVDLPQDIVETIIGAVTAKLAKEAAKKAILTALGGAVAIDGLANIAIDLGTLRDINKAAEESKKMRCDCSKVCKPKK